MSVLRWILIAIIWIAIAFWPARVADRKGHSFIGYFIFSLSFFPAAIIVAYLVHDRTQVPPRPAAVNYCTVRGPGTIGWACLDNTAEKAGLQALCPALPLVRAAHLRRTFGALRTLP
jgi:hypothetical protein